ncbi:MAG: hypothetical protein IT337_15215 [Thermomicrobiales bacterium]|nr:hypothetical protein [Thermomicrobiales bacterium]
MAQAAVPVAIGATLVGTGISAYAARRKGQEEAAAAEFERQQLLIQEQMTRIAATQAETRRREDLVSSIETIQAIAAGRGVGLASPTLGAAIESARAGTERDIRIERLNYLTKAEQSAALAGQAGRKARYSLLAGDLSAASTIASGVSRAASFGFGR